MAGATLNRARVPAWGLGIQCLWTCLLILPRTIKGRVQDYADLSSAGGGGAAFAAVKEHPKVFYGNLYGDLLDYVISAALLFYILTILGIFRLRFTRPNAPRPYKAFGYPIVPALYIAGAAALVGILFWYRWQTTWPGLVLVLLGVPVYYLWSGRPHGERS